MTGRTFWFPKDAAWWRRGRVVELGQAHGPVGPAVIDWLLCEAKMQNPAKGGNGQVKAGYAAIAHGVFSDTDTIKSVVTTAVEVGLLDDFEDADRTFTARVSGWYEDVERPLAAHRKAVQRVRETPEDDGGQPGTEPPLSPDVPHSHVTGQDSKEFANANSVEPVRLDARRQGEVSELFAYWQQRCGHGHAKLTPDRKRKIAARLREGYTPEQIRTAIDGAAQAAFVGENGKRYDDLELICRTGSKLEDFIERAGTQRDDAGLRARVLR